MCTSPRGKNYAAIFRREEQQYVAGRTFSGGGFTVLSPAPGAPTIGVGRRGPINNWTSEVGSGATIAVDPRTGKRVWTFPQYDVTDAGMLSTASDLLFTGGREGYFYALDAKTGRSYGKPVSAARSSMRRSRIRSNGKQYLSIISDIRS